MTGKELKQIIKQKGFILTDLAKSLNLSPQNLQSRLTAKEITFRFLLDVSSAKGVSLMELLSDTKYAVEVIDGSIKNHCTLEAICSELNEIKSLLKKDGQQGKKIKGRSPKNI